MKLIVIPLIYFFTLVVLYEINYNPIIIVGKSNNMYMHIINNEIIKHYCDNLCEVPIVNATECIT